VDALEFLKHLLDRERLAIAGAVALRPRTAAEVAAATSLPERTVLAALAPLRQAGLVEHDEGAGTYRLLPDGLRSLAHELPQALPPDPAALFGMTEDEQAVLSRFVRGNRLLEIPSTRSKRLVVLERLALEFEPGRRYAEREVNAALARWHEDTASLRRHLVDEGFLDRGAGEYWRAGGRVDLDRVEAPRLPGRG
jgi:hypothetical protein